MAFFENVQLPRFTAPPPSAFATTSPLASAVQGGLAAYDAAQKRRHEQEQTALQQKQFAEQMALEQQKLGLQRKLQGAQVAQIQQNMSVFPEQQKQQQRYMDAYIQHQQLSNAETQHNFVNAHLANIGDLPEADKANAYMNVRNTLINEGVSPTVLPPTYDKNVKQFIADAVANSPKTLAERQAQQAAAKQVLIDRGKVAAAMVNQGLTPPAEYISGSQAQAAQAPSMLAQQQGMASPAAQAPTMQPPTMQPSAAAGAQMSQVGAPLPGVKTTAQKSFEQEEGKKNSNYFDTLNTNAMNSSNILHDVQAIRGQAGQIPGEFGYMRGRFLNLNPKGQALLRNMKKMVLDMFGNMQHIGRGGNLLLNTIVGSKPEAIENYDQLQKTLDMYETGARLAMEQNNFANHMKGQGITDRNHLQAMWNKVGQAYPIIDAKGNANPEMSGKWRQFLKSSAQSSQHTPENIAFTAKKYGISEDEVRRRLGI